MKCNMNYNFNHLKSRIFDSVLQSDFDKINSVLSSLKEETLVSGVGGSYVVSTFLSKVLSEKNNIICENVSPGIYFIKRLVALKILLLVAIVEIISV